MVHDLEEVSELLGGNIDEVGLSDFFWLVPNPVLTLNIVVFAHELEELEGASVSNNALFVVNLLIYSDRLEDVFSQHVFFSDVVEIIVVDSCWGEGIVGVFSDVAIINVFEDKLAQFRDENIDIFHDFVEFIEGHFFDDILLGQGITTQHVSDTTEENGVGKLDIVVDVLFQELNDKFAQSTVFEFDLDLLDFASVVFPVIGFPFVDRFALFHGSFVVLLDYPSDELEEELFLTLR